MYLMYIYTYIYTYICLYISEMNESKNTENKREELELFCCYMVLTLSVKYHSVI